MTPAWGCSADNRSASWNLRAYKVASGSETPRGDELCVFSVGEYGLAFN